MRRSPLQGAHEHAPLRGSQDYAPGFAGGHLTDEPKHLGSGNRVELGGLLLMAAAAASDQNHFSLTAFRRLLNHALARRSVKTECTTTAGHNSGPAHSPRMPT